MYILVVEDDYLQADLIEEALRLEPSLTSARIERLSTESHFHANFERIAGTPPDLVIMDVMLRWADPTPDMQPPPPEIANQGFHRAGLRNERLLAQDPRTKSIPVILYTILEDLDLDGILEPQRLHYLSKDSRLDPLVQATRSLVGKG